MQSIYEELGLDRSEIRAAIQAEYVEVAEHPDKGFHFHTGRKLADILGYDEKWLQHVPEESLASFAGTGNPFRQGELKPGERVVDLACGAGTDTFIAASQVGPTGYVVGVDMTPAMIKKARASLKTSEFENIDFCKGFAEELPVTDGWADVVISNGSLNLMPDKAAVLAEIARVLKPGGRLQMADISVNKPVPTGAKTNIDLWTG